MSGIRYSYTGLVQDHERVREITDEVARDANEDEKLLLDALSNFSEEVFGGVFSQDQEGKFSIDVTGDVKHDGASLSVIISVRRTVLPHQNALDGSASAFPPTKSEERRKSERISRTRTEHDAPLPLPGAPHLVGEAKEEQIDREPSR